MLILDFDGVLYDGLHECALVTWLGAVESTGWRSGASQLRSVPLHFVRRFRTVRNYSRTLAGQNPASAVRVAELIAAELERTADGAGSGLDAARASALRLLDESVGYLVAAALRAAALVGVADHLEDGARTADELADATGTRADQLRRTLRLLATRRIVREEADGRFILTPDGDALRSGSPVSIRDAILMTTANSHWRSAGELVTALREGVPVFERPYDAPYYRHIEGGESAEVFQRGMASFSAAVDEVAVASCDFPERGTLVDVGGEAGGLLVQALRSRPALRGVLFDREQVLADHRLHDLGADDRWDLVAGDFFTDVPTGGDTYVLKRILHNWSDDECVRILENCRKAMAPGGRILIVDPVVRPGNGPDSATYDLIMMMLLSGRERTEAEFTDLLVRAGLHVGRIVHTAGPASVIQATATSA